MKVLYLNHPEADFGGYGLFDGLCTVLGPEQVIDYPFKPSYHGELHLYPNEYPSTWPPRAGNEAEPGGRTHPFEWAAAWPGRAYSEAEIRQLLSANAFGLVVCEGPRRGTLAALRQLRGALPPRVVLYDGEDHDQILTEPIRDHGVGLYLKRELLPKNAGLLVGSCAVQPFPFSTCLTEPLPTAEARDIDVLCAVGDTHPKREKIRAAVARLSGEGFRVDTARTPWPDYIERLGRARIAVAPRGFGQDTLRRWDVPAAGALLLQERLTILDPHPLEHDVHKVDYAEDGADFEGKLRYWLREEERRAQVARAGQDFVFTHHTAEARARQMLAWARSRWPELG